MLKLGHDSAVHRSRLDALVKSRKDRWSVLDYLQRLAFWRTLTRVLTKPATLTPTPLGKMDYNADKRARKPPRTFRKDLLRVQWGTCLRGFRAGEAKLSKIARRRGFFPGESLYGPWPDCAGDKSTLGGATVCQLGQKDLCKST